MRDVVRTLSQQASGIAAPAEKKIGFLRDHAEYKKYCELSDNITRLKADASKKVKEISARLKTEIDNDPVSQKYTEIFSGKIYEYSGVGEEKNC